MHKTADCACATNPAPLNYADSARAFRSLWKISKWARIFFPSRDGLIMNARRPLRSSDCVKTVEAPSLAGSIWNLCKPAIVNTGGPCQENKLSVFSLSVESLQLPFLSLGKFVVLTLTSATNLKFSMLTSILSPEESSCGVLVLSLRVIPLSHSVCHSGYAEKLRSCGRDNWSACRARN